MQLTPEQDAILEAAKGDENLMIIARAGCGKTTMIEQMARVLPRKGAIGAVAFNVKIKDELAERIGGIAQVLTLNGLGHKAWGAFLGRHSSVDGKKVYANIDQVLRTQGLGFSKEEREDLVSLYNTAKSAGWVPIGAPATAIPLLRDDMASLIFDYSDVDFREDLLVVLRAALKLSISEAFQGKIDYNDQIYMPVCFQAPVPKYDTLMVDEAQDLSILNHKLITKACGRRLIVVGDPAQAIYGFRGAASNSLDLLADSRPFKVLPLATTFRCGKAIVARQQAYIPDFRAFESNSEGQILDWRHIAGNKEVWSADDIPPGTTIICRNNAPLLSLAFKLIKAGRGCRMLGNDIGKALKRRLEKATMGLQPTADSDTMLDSIEDWRDKELRKAKTERKIASIEDTYDCLKAIAEEAKDLKAAKSFCEALFADQQAVVTLSSGHKAKGLEWDTVVHLDPFRIPSKYARTEEEKTQEYNIKYVIETRARNTLILANLEDYQ